MPGRAYIGLSPDEKHPSEFRPSRLPDEPMVTVWLVIGAALAAFAVIAIGYLIHHHDPRMCDGLNGRTVPCRIQPHYWGQDLPMIVWFSLGALAATLVLAVPFLMYELKRKTGRV